MPITGNAVDVLPEGIRLTKRQREVWEMTHGVGDNEPMRAPEIAEKLGISTNSVYVTRRRVKQAIEAQGGPVATDGRRKQPKAIRHLAPASGLGDVAVVLESKLSAIDAEEQELRTRLDQLQRERPAIAEMVERLKALESAPQEDEVHAAA